MTDPIEGLLAQWGDDVGLALVRREQVSRWGVTDRAVPLASVTKPIVALACWVALEEGSLALDQPAGPPGSTVEHLLCHASGLPFEGAEPIAAPGARRIYSNNGFEQLTDHLSAAVGTTWQDYVSEAVLHPLGMASTTLGPSSARDATGSVDDLVHLALELLAPRLVHGSTFEAAITNRMGDLDGVVPGFGQQRPCPWGLGVELKGTKRPHWTPTGASLRTFGHFGAAGTFLWVDPDRRLAAVATGTRPFGPWAVDLWPVLGDRLLDLV